MGAEHSKSSEHNDSVKGSKKKRSNKKVYEEVRREEMREKAVGSDMLKKLDTTRLNHSLDEPIDNYYTITEKVLGTGNFSVVKIGINKETNEKCAIKIIDKSLVKNKPEMLSNEVDILLRVNHPSVIALKDLFNAKNTMMVCMELVTGGELFDRIVEREKFTELEARNVMSQLFKVLEYLHSLGIVHRDLKPENLLLANEHEDTIKIADFGLSKIYTEDMMSTACGTPGYVAPEILQCEGYDEEVDMWSCGIIMYILLCGYPPFYNENDARLFDAIMAGEYEFHSPYWNDISEHAKNLIRKLLVVNPHARLSAKAAMQDEWFKVHSKMLSANKFGPDFKTNLQKHNSMRKASMANMKANSIKAGIVV